MTFAGMKYLLFTLLLCGGIATTLPAQNSFTDKSCRKYPHWITMMDDTLANYNDVIRAFDLYWEEHEMPFEEDQIVGMKDADEKERKEPSQWLRRLFSSKRTPDETEIAYALKRYRYWKLMSEPWVQEDGTILSPYQRRQIIESIQR